MIANKMQGNIIRTIIRRTFESNKEDANVKQDDPHTIIISYFHEIQRMKGRDDAGLLTRIRKKKKITERRIAQIGHFLIYLLKEIKGSFPSFWFFPGAPSFNYLI